MTRFHQVSDWRGTPILAGDTVLYGASYGSHSVEMVEAHVDPREPFTPSGRVRLIPVRRSRASSWGKPRSVVVRPESLTVIHLLGRSNVPTEAEKWAAWETRTRG